MILLSLFLCFVGGCAISEEEQKKRETYYNQAMENAKEYIENKYGFTPKFISAKCSDTGKFGTECSEMILVDMEYNSKDFLVYISGSEKTLDGMDNYQYEEIVQDIYYELQNAIGVVPYNYVIKFRRFGSNNVINTYYDKSNLKDIVNSYGVVVLFEFINEKDYRNGIDLDKLNLFDKDMLRGWHDLYFVNYFSKQAYDETPEYVHSGTSNFVPYAPNIESLVSIEYGKVEYHSLDLIKKDDMYFLVDGENSDDVVISKTSLDDLDNWGYSGMKQISQAYWVDSCNDFYVYIPISRYKKHKVDNLRIVQQYNGNYYINDFRTSGYVNVGNYYVTRVVGSPYCNIGHKVALVEIQ